MLEDASIKLSAVASSLNTVSARAMLTAMINGETDPLVIADMAKGTIPDLAQSVTGHFGTHHALMARAILRRLDLVEEALKESDAMVADACQPWAHQIELPQTIPGVGEKVAEVIVAESGSRSALLRSGPSESCLAFRSGSASRIALLTNKQWASRR